ncbi:MAG: hypothetical protein MJZ18_04545 [Bacteroidales bacterium]|nr:hypothetical protein [Bacteroidales bacterium]
MTDKFDDIILRLQAQQPSLDNADELTDMTMASLPDQQQTPAIAPKGPRVLYIIRNISSAAAMFLIALFIWQYNEVPELTPSEFSQTGSNSEQTFFCDGADRKECINKYIETRRSAKHTLIEQLKRVHHENNQ